MNETLKKDLCARLPYGVKFNYNGTIKEISGIRDWIGLCVSFKEKHGETNIPISTVKPILFPISCLTKEITVNGETFVPIVELLKLEHEQWYKEQSNTRYSEIEFSSTPNSAKACFSFMATKDITLYTLMPWNFPQWIIEKFHSWHINYRLAPEQFVEATNEYE